MIKDLQIHLSKLLLIVLIILSGCQTSQIASDPYIAFDQKQYHVAIPLLKKEYQRTNSNISKGKVAFYIAESYNKVHNQTEAGEWYKTHYDITENYNSLELYAQSLKSDKDYKAAARIYKQLSKQTSRTRYFRKQSELCLTLESWMNEDKMNIDFTRLSFNSIFSEYGTYLWDDHLIYSSDKPTTKETYYWSGDGFSKLYSYSLQDDETSLLKATQAEGHQGTITFNKDHTLAIYTLCKTNDEKINYCQLVSSTIENDNWSKPEALNFVNGNQNFVHPSLTKDGKTLYFASNNIEGWGEYDIYVSHLSKGMWSSPRVLPRRINTEKTEMFPRISNDTLYFSSNGLDGMGGLDIFYSIRKGKKWSNAVNLKHPINSPKDDYGLWITRETKDDSNYHVSGYLTSNRDSKKGKTDIFSFNIKKDISIPIEIIEPSITPIFILNLSFIDNEKNVISPKAITSIISPNLEKQITSKQIVYSDLDKEGSYSFSFSSKGYLTKSLKYFIPREYWDTEDSIIYLDETVILDKIELNKEIVLENVYYDFNKSNLRQDAFPALNSLLNILNNNPNIKIQLSSHTDCRGKNNYNLSLSQKRAESVVNYLISQGIDTYRLQAKGFGELSPAIPCNCSDCTEEEHQINRRTTFSIIES